MLSMQHNGEPTKEWLVRDLEVAFSNLSKNFRRIAAAVRRLQVQADAVAAASNQRIVQVKKAPPRDANGTRIKRAGPGRPRRSTNRAGITIFASEKQIDELRAQLQPPPAQPER